MSVNSQPTLLSKAIAPFLVRKIPSIFTTRNGKFDIVIHKETGENWGALYSGKRYTIAMILDAETFQPVRSNLTVPNDILNNLKTWGF
jgi:hypothetical protein